MSDGYTESSFWDKLVAYAKDAGLDVVKKALELYYASTDEDTPVWAKGLIYGALAYFISPIDAIPDFTPFAGYSDDLGVLATASATVAAYITSTVKKQAQAKLSQWFD